MEEGLDSNFVLSQAISSQIYQGDLAALELQAIREGQANAPHPIDWADDLSEASSLDSNLERGQDWLLTSTLPCEEEDPTSLLPLTKSTLSFNQATEPKPLMPLATDSPTIPSTSNPVELMLQEGVPMNQLRATWIKRWLPTEGAQLELLAKAKHIAAIPDKDVRAGLWESLWPHPLPDTPTAARFPIFAGRWAQMGAHSFVIDLVQKGLLLDWVQCM